MNHIDVYVYQYNCSEDDRVDTGSQQASKQESIKMDEVYEPIDTAATPAVQPKDSDAKRTTESSSSVLDKTDWLYVKEKFTKVDIEAFHGLSKIQKFDLLLAHFSSTGYVSFKRAEEWSTQCPVL